MRVVAAFSLALGCHGPVDEPSVAKKSAELAAPAAPTTPTPAAEPLPAPTPASTLVTHLAPGGVEEHCQLLVAFPFTPPDVKADPKAMRWYREDDFEEIAELCAMSLYAASTTDTVTAVGICTKTHWSTPALEVHALDKVGLTKAQFEKTRCTRDRRLRGAKKLAKFKFPIYGKEPESALMYFHLSRLLGAAPFIMPHTYRTVSRTELRKWSGTAIGTLKSRTLGRLNPLEGWSVLHFRHKKGDAVVAGSFSENARGERYHKPFTYLDESKEKRIGVIWHFKSRPYYQLAASKRPLDAHLTFDVTQPRSFAQALQAVAYAQDFTHMLILDHVFNQRDRSGNINSRVRHHYIDDQQHLRWKKNPNGPDDDHPTVPLERLLLKDNDDGLRWDIHGWLNASLIIDDLRHLDALTYARLQWLAKLMTETASKDIVKAYFVDSVHVAPATYDEVRERLIDLAARFERKQSAGELFLDLDLEPVLAKRGRGAPDATKPVTTKPVTTKAGAP